MPLTETIHRTDALISEREENPSGGESPNLTDRAEGTPLEGGWSVRGRVPTQTAHHKREAVSAPEDHPRKRSRPLTQSPHHTPSGELLKSHPPHLSSHPHVTTANEESGSYSSLTAEVTPQSVLTLLCPWTKEIPTHLRQRLHWSPTPLPEGEIHDPTALILYAGDDDPTSLHQAMLQESQHWPVQILEIDNKRPGKAIEHDMLREEQYGRLCRAAMQGKLRALLGGPNCRTWSILRWFPKPGAPQPFRGRHPDLTWAPRNTTGGATGH